MKRVVFLFMFIVLGSTINAQQKHDTAKIIIVGGLRIFPFFTTDFNDFKAEYVRVNIEVGSLINQKFYVSLGYTPIGNSYYTFEEYWFIGLDRKNPVAVVGEIDYCPNTGRFVYNLGFGFQKGFANAKVLMYSGFGEFKPRLKIGVIFPLNWEVYRK